MELMEIKGNSILKFINISSYKMYMYMCHVDRHIHVPVLVELYNDSYWVTHHCDRDIIENSDYF
jgi:hypothetical protein